MSEGLTTNLESSAGLGSVNRAKSGIQVICLHVNGTFGENPGAAIPREKPEASECNSLRPPPAIPLLQ